MDATRKLTVFGIVGTTVAAGIVAAVVWVALGLDAADRELARQHSLVRAHADLSETVEGLEGTVRRLANDFAAWRPSSVAAAPAGAAHDPRVDEILERLDRLEAELAALRDAIASSPSSVADESTHLGLRTLATPDAKGAAWSAEQATGAPDTLRDGDQSTAWASLEPDGGAEWLELEFERAVIPTSIVIRETYNPGAVVRVETIGEDGISRTVWSGTDGTKKSPGELVIDLERGAARTQKIVVHLDTRLVEGWNEIDAVGLRAGRRTYWATSARASSTYASRAGTVVRDE